MAAGEFILSQRPFPPFPGFGLPVQLFQAGVPDDFLVQPPVDRQLVVPHVTDTEVKIVVP